MLLSHVYTNEYTLLELELPRVLVPDLHARKESTIMPELGIVMPSRYRLIDKLSADSIYAYYGVDELRHEEVAVKIYGNLFANNMEFIKSVWNELFITRMIYLDGSHPSIVKCLRFMKAPQFVSNFSYAAIVYEFMDADLHCAEENAGFQATRPYLSRRSN